MEASPQRVTSPEVVKSESKELKDVIKSKKDTDEEIKSEAKEPEDVIKSKRETDEVIKPETKKSEDVLNTADDSIMAKIIKKETQADEPKNNRENLF